MKRTFRSFKRIITVCVIASLVISTSCAEGFFPSIDQLFGVSMPSISFALNRESSSVMKDADGVHEVYESVSPNDYDRLGIYMAAEGCSCDEYKTEDRGIIMAIGKDGSHFTLSYDLDKSIMQAIYPLNTRIEKERGPYVASSQSIFPDIGFLFGIELPSLAPVLNPSEITIYKPETVNRNQRYLNVMESAYDIISRYLGYCGCTLNSYSTNTGVFSAQIEKEGCIFDLKFDNTAHIITAVYPQMSSVVYPEYLDDSSVEGIFPSIDKAFGTLIPNPSLAINRDPDETTELEDGSVQEIYVHFSEEDYNLYSMYLQQSQCKVIDHALNGDILSITLEKNEGRFQFVYDKKNEQATIIYLVGTRPIATPTPVPTKSPEELLKEEIIPYARAAERFLRDTVNKYGGALSIFAITSEVYLEDDTGLVYMTYSYEMSPLSLQYALVTVNKRKGEYEVDSSQAWTANAPEMQEIIKKYKSKFVPVE